MNEHTEPYNDPSNKPSRIEQQLKQFRPRAAQLDLTAFAHTSAQSHQISASAASLTTARTGFSATQLATAVAASWLLGVVVGGGCIFYAITSNVAAVAKSTEVDHREPDSPPQPDVLSPPVHSAQPANTAPPRHTQPNRNQSIASQANQIASSILGTPARSISAFHITSPFYLDRDSLTLDSQLTTRGLVQRSSHHRTGDHYVTTTSEQTANEPFAPSSPTNRSQLMKDFLSDPSFQIQ